MTLTTLPRLLSMLTLGAIAVGSLQMPGFANRSLKPLVNLPQLQASSDISKNALSTAQSSESPRFVLQGSISTIQEAIDEEQNIDWYQWYLGARAYLFRTGGIPCSLGTDIRFNKDGRIDSNSTEARCVQSLSMRFYPLPADTQLNAVILPVRSGQAPPASREEIYNRIQSD